MGLLDKVKQVAGEVGDAAKKGASQVQSKVEQGQLRKKADEAAKKLGYLVVAERQGGAPLGAEAAALVDEITSIEAQLEEARAQAAAAGETVEGSGETPTPAEGQAAEESAGE